MRLGLLPTAYCRETREEIFALGTQPTAPDNIWLPVAINRETGKRATACTPPEPPPRRHVFETLDAAMRYADSIRAVPV